MSLHLALVILCSTERSGKHWKRLARQSNKCDDKECTLRQLVAPIDEPVQHASFLAIKLAHCLPIAIDLAIVDATAASDAVAVVVTVTDTDLASTAAANLVALVDAQIATRAETCSKTVHKWQIDLKASQVTLGNNVDAEAQ